MMRGMRHPAGPAAAAPASEPAVVDGAAVAERAAEIARLRRAIRQLKSRAGALMRAPAGPGGQKIGLGPARESASRSVVTVPVTSRLPHGIYTVTWQVISSDGDLVGSQYRFAVGPAPTSLGSAPAAAPPSAPGQWPTAI